MIEIRDTKPGSKRRELWVDDELVRAIPVDVLRASGIRDGHAVEPDALRDAIEAVEKSCAHERALRLIGYRERSVHEIRTRLLDDGYEAGVVVAMVERFADVGLLDDARYAGVYVRTKRSAGWGSRRIARALADAGIDEPIALDAITQELPPEEELGRAVAILSNLRLDTVSGRQRALRRLVARGFDYQVAREAVRAASDRFPSGDATTCDS
ncbi:MAG: RecX family transcriptional regulator [Actinomycetota bacterium]|nr:RecX family transcriptional regulator [Actinomycetota bacterium]